MRRHDGKVEMAHHAVVLGVEDLLLQDVEVGEPIQAGHYVGHVAVLELNV